MWNCEKDGWWLEDFRSEKSMPALIIEDATGTLAGDLWDFDNDFDGDFLFL